MTSEVVLLFDTKDLTNVAEQLGEAFDKHSSIGNNYKTPTMMIVRKTVWIALEKELTKLIEKRYKTSNTKQYDRVNPDPNGPQIQRPPNGGYNAIIFRGRPVVAIDGDNVVAARVGAL